MSVKEGVRRLVALRQHMEALLDYIAPNRSPDMSRRVAVF